MSGWDWAWAVGALAVIVTSVALACFILGGHAARRTEPPARDARSPSPAPGPEAGSRERAEQAAKDLIRDPGPRPRVLYTIRAWENGVFCIWDGQRQLVYKHRPGDRACEIEALERLLRDS